MPLTSLSLPLLRADAQRPSRNKYIKNYDFAYRLPPPLGGHGDADFTVTAVLGHLTDSVSISRAVMDTAHLQDFDNDHRKWSSCDPFALFDARIVTQVSSVSRLVWPNDPQG
jgi:DNA topoisomerase-3